MNTSTIASRDTLARAVTSQIQHGWRVETQNDYQAVIVRGRRPNHVLHLILSLLTLGCWLLVWIPLTIWGHEKRATISVDSGGAARIDYERAYQQRAYERGRTV